MKKTGLLALMALMLIGCNSTTTNNDTNITDETTITPPTTQEGDSITITNATDVQVNDNDSITIDCAAGGCGDITINRKKVQ